MRFMAFATTGMTCLVAALCCGCAPEQATSGAKVFFFRSAPADLARLRMVTFVEIDHGKKHPEISRQLTTGLARSIQEKGHFRVRIVRRDDPVCEMLSLERDRDLSLEGMARTRRALKSDAVLYGSLTTFNPYPRMRIGLRLSLVDLRRGTTLWWVDHVWDTADKAVERRLKRFFETQQRGGMEPANWELGLLSPLAFQRFVAYEVAGTFNGTPDKNDGGDGFWQRLWAAAGNR